MIPTRSFASTDPELATIDQSVRWPVLACFLTAVHWLVVGTFLLVYALSLRHPQNGFPVLDGFTTLSENFSSFTYGRVWAAAISCLFYGWASTVSLGLGLWLFARLSRVPLRFPSLVFIAVFFWNLGVAGGVTGIFMGDGTGVELLELPAYASAGLFFSYCLLAVWGVLMFLQRQPGREFISQAWLLLAFFAFPWFYSIGNYLLVWYAMPLNGNGNPETQPMQGSGVAQTLVSAWFTHGIVMLWLVPVGLALLYYLISKISSLTIKYYSWSSLAFWGWVAIAPWTAVHDLVGGPFPAWLVSMGLLLSCLLFLPVVIIGMNLILTVAKAEEANHGQSLILPFLFIASILFITGGFFELLLSIRGINQILRFSIFRDADFFVWLYGFFSFTAFGALYYVVPRLFNFGWRSTFLIRAHFYSSVYGILLVIALLGLGGIFQGLTLENNDPVVSITTANHVTLSFFIAGTMCVSLVSLGNGIFAFHFGWFFFDWLRLRVRDNATFSELFFEPYLAAEENPTIAALTTAPEAHS